MSTLYVFSPRQQDDGVSIDVYGYIILRFIYLFISRMEIRFFQISLILLIDILILLSLELFGVEQL
jgi:hypothetical protein